MLVSEVAMRKQTYGVLLVKKQIGTTLLTGNLALSNEIMYSLTFWLNIPLSEQIL